jgi:hypothetical protein
MSGRAPFYLKDGVWVMVMLAVGGSSNIISSNYLFVDLNGSTPPNKLGVDVFLLERTEKGILPYGHKQSDNSIYSDCSETGSGNFCAERIRREGWKINY